MPQLLQRLVRLLLGTLMLLGVTCAVSAAALTDNGDTVTDTATGLTWLKASLGPLTWEQALAAVEGGGWAGQGDWRLPNRSELQTLVDYAIHSPAIDKDRFPGTQSNNYWTSTTNPSAADQAWYVNFQYGYVSYAAKTTAYYLRPVRGGNVTAVARPARYRDNGDTITDQESGLTWLKSSLGPYTWEQALALADGGTWGEHGGWRLPNRNELQTLVWYERHSPSIDKTAFPDTQSNNYWTATTNPSAADQAWYVNFQYGYVSYAAKTTAYYLRPVWGGKVTTATNYPRFTPNADGVVTDNDTGLEWLAPSQASVTWQAALAAAESGAWGGHDDWRLPDRNELQTLVWYERHSPAIDKTAFPDTQSNNYWTATTNPSTPAQAWYVNFQYGYVSYAAKSTAYPLRLVRGAQTGGVPRLGVLTPVFGETLNKGQTGTITWNSRNLSTPIQIDLYQGETLVQQVAAGAANIGSYSLAPAANITDGGDYRIKLSADSGKVTAWSGYFTIQESSTLALDYPGAATVLGVGQQLALTFTTKAKIAQYEWDFNNDGTPDAITTDNTNTHSFQEAGHSTIKVTAITMAGYRLESVVDIEVLPLEEVIGTMLFSPWYPESDATPSEVMQGGKAVRHYRLVDAETKVPLSNKLLYYQLSGQSQLISTLTDDQGFVKIITPPVVVNNTRFSVLVTDSTGDSSELTVQASPNFTVNIKPRQVTEEYELLIGGSFSVGAGLPGFKVGPLALKTAEATVGAGQDVSSRFVYDDYGQDADFMIQSALGTSLGVELQAGLFGHVFENKTLPEIEVGASIEGKVSKEFTAQYEYPGMVKNNAITDKGKALEAGIALLDSAINAQKSSAISSIRLRAALIDKLLALYGIDAIPNETGERLTRAGSASLDASITLTNPLGTTAGSEWGIKAQPIAGNYAYSFSHGARLDGTASISQTVTQSLDLGRFGLFYGQKFGGDKRRKDTPKFTGASWFRPLGSVAEGDWWVEASSLPGGGQLLEFSHLEDRQSSNYLLFGTSTWEKNFHLFTDDSATVSVIKANSAMAQQMLQGLQGGSIDFDYSPSAYEKLQEAFTMVPEGKVAWEERVTERTSLYIPIEFELSVGLSLGAGINVEAISELSYAGSKGRIERGAQFETERYDKDAFVSNAVKGYSPFLNAAKEAVRDVAKDIVETIEGTVIAGKELVVDVVDGAKAKVKSAAGALSSGYRIFVTKVKGLAPSYQIMSVPLITLAGTTPSPGVAATVGEVFIVNVLDENGQPIVDFPAGLELTINYTEADLQAAGFLLAEAAKLRIFRWDGETGYYSQAGGVLDETNMTVTTSISKPGQYILAIDEQAPDVQQAVISNSSPQPEISLSISDSLSGIDASSIRFLLDGVEVVNSANLSSYFTPASGRFVFTPATPLATGQHSAELVVCDAVGNQADAVWDFMVNASPPVIMHTPIESADSGAPLLIAATATDDEGSPSLFLHYRAKKDEMPYTMVEMTWSEAESCYQAEVPATHVTSHGVRYYLSAEDLSGNEVSTDEYDVVVNDTTGPVIPGVLQVVRKDGVFELSWTAAPDIDVQGYKVYLGASLASLAATEEVGLLPVAVIAGSEGRSFAGVRAIDTIGNEGPLLGGMPVALEFDQDGDGDVDGLDVATIAKSMAADSVLDMEQLAKEFGWSGR